MMNGWGGGYDGGASVIGGILMVAFWVAIIAGIALLVVWLTRQVSGGATQSNAGGGAGAWAAEMPHMRTDGGAVGGTPAPGVVALGGRAPRRDRRAAAGSLAFTAAKGVIHRGHRHAAHVRRLAEPPVAARLADRHVLVIEVADLADRRHALDVDLPDFS